MELKDLEAADELQINTATQQATQQNPKKTETTCHHCKTPSYYHIQNRQLKQQKNHVQNNMDSAGNNKNIFVGPTNSNSNKKSPCQINAMNTNNQKDKKPRPVYTTCNTYGKTNHSRGKCYFGASASKRPPPRNRRPEGQNQVQQRNAQNNSAVNVPAAAQNFN